MPLIKLLLQTRRRNQRKLASLPEIRCLLCCAAENVIRHKQMMGPACLQPEEERQLTSACLTGAQGHVQLCSDRAAISPAGERNFSSETFSTWRQTLLGGAWRLSLLWCRVAKGTLLAYLRWITVYLGAKPSAPSFGT